MSKPREECARRDARPAVSERRLGLGAFCFTSVCRRSYDRSALAPAYAAWVFPWRAQRGRSLKAASHQTTHQRPREHAFGEDRGRAGEAEHPRVGAAREWPKVPALR
jgi:hypothetical protein